jgi:hypothetical protein
VRLLSGWEIGCTGRFWAFFAIREKGDDKGGWCVKRCAGREHCSKLDLVGPWREWSLKGEVMGM